MLGSDQRCCGVAGLACAGCGGGHLGIPERTSGQALETVRLFLIYSLAGARSAAVDLRRKAKIVNSESVFMLKVSSVTTQNDLF
jgi:hypothetical protein